MPRATFASVQLARFDRLREAGPFEPATDPETLFLQRGYDIRAAGTDPTSGQAFKFVVLGLHTSAEAAERTLASRRAWAPWFDEAAEWWGGVLQPFRHYGEVNHLGEPGPVFDAVGDAPGPDEPIVVVTSSGWQLGEGLDMTRVQAFSAGVSAVRVGMTGVDGLHSQQSFFFPGVLVTDPITVTTWRNFDAMRGFAYGPGVHRHNLDNHRAAPLSDRTSFTRYRIVRSEGTWYGAEPLGWAR